MEETGWPASWGRTTLPWMRPEEFPGPACYCGFKGCIETWISGTGLQADYERATKTKLPGKEIIARSETGEAAAVACLERFEDRLTRSLAQMVNILDPDVIVLGGGVSQVPRLYRNVPQRLKESCLGRKRTLRWLSPSTATRAACAGRPGCVPLGQIRGNPFPVENGAGGSDRETARAPEKERDVSSRLRNQSAPAALAIFAIHSFERG